MLFLNISVNFQVGVEFLSRYFDEFLAHKPVNQLHNDTAKTAKEILIVVETPAVVLMWATAEYRRNHLTFWSAGQ
jgi:hypothetical protein